MKRLLALGLTIVSTLGILAFLPHDGGPPGPAYDALVLVVCFIFWMGLLSIPELWWQRSKRRDPTKALRKED
jgi:uncharacterized iron-regulated membrane protein